MTITPPRSVPPLPLFWDWVAAGCGPSFGRGGSSRRFRASQLLLAWGTLELGRGYWLRIHGGYDDLQVMPLASEIAATHQEHRSGGDGRSRLVPGRPLLRAPAREHGHRARPGCRSRRDPRRRLPVPARRRARFARTWVSWSGGGGSARSARTSTGSPMSEHASRRGSPRHGPGAEPGRPARPRVVRRRCPGGAEVLGRDTHSRGTGGDVAALRRGCPRGSGVGRRPRARAREARRLRLARTRPERHARRLVRGARGAQPGRRAGRSCASLSVPTYPGEP